MSIISSLVHHEIHDLPNDVHNIPDGKSPTHSSAVDCSTPELNLQHSERYCNPQQPSILSAEAQKQLKAFRKKVVRPAMYYSEDVRRPYKNGAWQNSHAVESEVELREETPRG